MAYEFRSLAEAYEFAIAQEQRSHEFYIWVAEEIAVERMKDVFWALAREELGHKAKLEAVREGVYELSSEDEPPGLGIADGFDEDDIEIAATMGYRDVLVLAMQREKTAYRLYLDMAASGVTRELTELFLALAAEEAKHKLRFELEYDAEVS